MRERADDDLGNLALMRLIEETRLPSRFYGSRRISYPLKERGQSIHRKGAQRVMLLMDAPSTCEGSTSVLEDHCAEISMDSMGRWMDNTLFERR